MERLAAEAPNNTLVNEIYLPEVKAAAALLQHHPEQVAGLVVPGRSLPAGVEGSSSSRPSIFRDEESAASHNRL